MARGRPRGKRPEVEPIRRKCATCGKIRVVKHRSWSIPTVSSEYSQPTYNPNSKKKDRIDQPGVTVTNYCSIECGGESFVNPYTEDDFLR